MSLEKYKVAAMDEFLGIISHYMLPLFDVRGELKLKEAENVNSELVSFDYNNSEKKIIKFYPCIGTEDKPSPFYCEVGTYSSTAIKKRLEAIMREVLKVTEFNCSNNKIQKIKRIGEICIKSGL